MREPEADAGDRARRPVAVDGMGGDGAPRVAVEGAIRAVRGAGMSVTLIGRERELVPIVSGLGGPFTGLTVVDAPDVVTMEEHAVGAVRHKLRASIPVAMEEVKSGRASAVVSAGNSGAVVAAAIFVLGRLPGVERPGIAVTSPAAGGGRVLFIDVGAVSDPRPSHLLQYAYLATSYLARVEGVTQPRIALLSNGEESDKGNQLTREAHRLLQDAPGVRFVGNTEGSSMLSGQIDAVICDGFSGNLVLKTGEGVIQLVQASLRRELTSRWYLTLLAAALRPALRRAAASLDYREYGGALLLGVNGVVIIAHGRSNPTAIKNAIMRAQRAAERDLPAALADSIGEQDNSGAGARRK